MESIHPHRSFFSQSRSEKLLAKGAKKASQGKWASSISYFKRVLSSRDSREEDKQLATVNLQSAQAAKAAPLSDAQEVYLRTLQELSINLPLDLLV